MPCKYYQKLCMVQLLIQKTVSFGYHDMKKALFLGLFLYMERVSGIDYKVL